MSHHKVRKKGSAPDEPEATSSDESEWVDITPQPIGSPEQREAIGWQRARELVSKAMSDYAGSQSPQALKLLALLQDIFADWTPDNWLAYFDKVTKFEINKLRAEEQHRTRNLAISWVREHYANKQEEYTSKKKFAKDYFELVRDQFGLTVSKRVIAESWLKGL